ncbi:hypothetical protein [Rhodopila sp.]|uniref:hypothetical protein n=1 Tax=Rhodopila sp. TaxID=2480087 RepID=UPI003D097490
MTNSVGSSPFWFGFSLNFWDWAGSKLLVVAVFAGIFAALASGLSSGISSAVTAKIQDTAGIRITAAESELQKSRERIATLTLQSDQLKNDNLKLALRLAELTQPRDIDVDAVVKAAKSFPGATFDMNVLVNDPETERFATLIEEALLKAGWKELSWKTGTVKISRPGKPNWGLNNSSGAAILVDTKEAESVALAVLPALKLTTKKFEINSTHGAPPEFGSPGALHFVIGKKPISSP